MNKLEIYAILALMLVATGGGLYFKGRHDEKVILTEKALADSAKVLSDANDALRARTEADNAARGVANNFMATVQSNMMEVNTRFAHVPQVIINDKGCPDIAPSFRLRWNADTYAVEAGPGTNSANSTVPASSTTAGP
jgi:hypothetical protein